MHSPDAKSPPPGLGAILDTLLESTEGQEKISVGDLLSAFGHRAFGPLILLPAVLLTLPTGAVPGVPLVLGAVIGLVAFELLIGRDRPSIPSLFSKVKVSRASFKKGREKASSLLNFVDSVVEPRMPFLVRPPVLQLAALTCIALALVLIPVEIIPFATAIPGTALIIIGLAITAKDGLVMLLGLLATAAAGAGIYFLLI